VGEIIKETGVVAEGGRNGHPLAGVIDALPMDMDCNGATDPSLQPKQSLMTKKSLADIASGMAGSVWSGGTIRTRYGNRPSPKNLVCTGHPKSEKALEYCMGHVGALKQSSTQFRHQPRSNQRK